MYVVWLFRYLSTSHREEKNKYFLSFVLQRLVIVYIGANWLKLATTLDACLSQVISQVFICIVCEAHNCLCIRSMFYRVSMKKIVSLSSSENKFPIDSHIFKFIRMIVWSEYVTQCLNKRHFIEKYLDNKSLNWGTLQRWYFH